MSQTVNPHDDPETVIRDQFDDDDRPVLERVAEMDTPVADDAAAILDILDRRGQS